MSEKRFFWLKLEKNFFDDKLIKKLRRMAGGDTYCIIYLRLILESMESDGSLYFDGVEGTFAEELALSLDESVESVQAVLAILVATNRVVQADENEMKMLDFYCMTGSETSSTRRSRKCRSLQKALQCNDDATDVQHNGDAVQQNDAQSKRESKRREEKESIALFFETIWDMYPNKKGKSSVKAAQRQRLYDIGYDKLKAAVEAYIDQKEDWRQFQDGSRFFNTTYQDYLDSNNPPRGEATEEKTLDQMIAEREDF